MSNRGALKAIAPVPTSADFLDIVLSGLQRKTPTQIHKGFKISRIRSFYMRKVKWAQDAFHERLDKILTEFPVLDNLHPFLASLLNVLYDKNHYKLALGQLNTARHLVDAVGKDYARLLKFGDSLYRCKMLKKAALGRMATIMKRQKDPLAYLEQVRQHMSRLPAIDPTTRTLLICGYPNVGKSSFVNKVTRADVDVQPYAFTTKSLFVGHMDYKYLRWQVIDTPGVLDHPLDEMNTIEMQSITALAHLRSCVMYFMDLSEQCGYTVEAQCKLYESIKPLFANKPTFIVVNKIDVMRPEDLDEGNKALLDSLLEDENVNLLQLSCVSEEGVMDVRNAACDALLAHRVETKEKTKRVDNVVNRLRVATPTARDDVVRTAHIPVGVAERKKYDPEDPMRRRLEKDLEAEGGGAGVYSSDLKKTYLLANDDWKHDILPELANGKNVADFIDADILARLDELEKEEIQLDADGYYDSDDGEEADSADEAIRETATAIRLRRDTIRLNNHTRKDAMRNLAPIPRKNQNRKVSSMTEDMRRAGYDPSSIEARAAMVAQARTLSKAAGKRKRNADDMEVDADQTAEGFGWVDEEANEGMDVDEASTSGRNNKKAKGMSGQAVALKSGRLPKSDRNMAGLRDEEQLKKAVKIHRFAQREPNRLAKASESDRAIKVKMPKWLYQGKRSKGSSRSR